MLVMISLAFAITGINIVSFFASGREGTNKNCSQALTKFTREKQRKGKCKKKNGEQDHPPPPFPRLCMRIYTL